MAMAVVDDSILQEISRNGAESLYRKFPLSWLQVISTDMDSIEPVCTCWILANTVWTGSEAYLCFNVPEPTKIHYSEPL